MQFDPTQYRFHDGLIEAIEYQPENQQLILSIELNFALAVTYDPTNQADDFRQMQLIFDGVASIIPALPLFNSDENNGNALYADILGFDWIKQEPRSSVHLIFNLFDPLKNTQHFTEALITYDSVIWKIEEPII